MGLKYKIGYYNIKGIYSQSYNNDGVIHTTCTQVYKLCIVYMFNVQLP